MATTHALLDAALAKAKAARDADLADLVEELRIPSVSAVPAHREDCLRNARWLRDRMEALGMKAQLVDVVDGGLPLVLGDWNGRPGKQHLTIYGHYDVQPADPVEGWTSPPFEPEIRGGHIYARGSSDSKGNHLATLKAVEHLFAAGGPPINLRFLIEGEEESSGHTIARYVRANGSKLNTDAVLVWDGGFDEFDNPALATALRGILYVELHATGPAVDLHSGTFGGIAPNPINTLARIIGELKDRNGHITIPDFYDNVRPPTDEELADWKGKDRHYAETVRQMTGVRALEGEPGFLAIELTCSRPTLDANGIIGGYTGDGAKTVIPAHASAKVSMRLVSDQDWKAILVSLEKYVNVLTTPGVQIKVVDLGSSPPVVCGADHAPARALRAAYSETFGRETALVRAGGSIPVTVDFQEAVGAPILVSGISQADDAAHSPNEHLIVDQYHRGIEAVIRFICKLDDQ